MRKTAIFVALLFLLPLLASGQEPLKGAFKEGSVTVKGEGVGPSEKSLSPGQRRILALRAAKVSALREAAEVIGGVRVSGETVVRDAAVLSDRVSATVEGVIRGAYVSREEYDPLSDRAVVYLTIPLTGPNGFLARVLPEISPLVESPGQPFFEPFAGKVSARFDGLIIDLRGLPFRPALVNRIITPGGDVLFDPLRLDPSVLEQTGGPRYTDDTERAKEILSGLGSSNPAVIRARDVKNTTDAVVDPDDAVRIFAADQRTGFLGKSRVVFVIE